MQHDTPCLYGSLCIFSGRTGNLLRRSLIRPGSRWRCRSEWLSVLQRTAGSQTLCFDRDDILRSSPTWSSPQSSPWRWKSCRRAVYLALPHCSSADSSFLVRHRRFGRFVRIFSAGVSRERQLAFSTSYHTHVLASASLLSDVSWTTRVIRRSSFQSSLCFAQEAQFLPSSLDGRANFCANVDVLSADLPPRGPRVTLGLI